VNRLVVSLVAPIVLVASLALGLAPPSAVNPAVRATVRAGAAGGVALQRTGPVTTRVDGVSAQASAGLTAIHFVDAQHGWLAGLGFILASADGGQTWAPQFSTTDPIGGFDFVDASTGWAVGARSLVGTRDGGQRWERRGDADPPLAQVSFATPDLGWGVAGGAHEPVPPGSGGAAPPGLMAVTDNAGEFWRPLPASPPPVQSVCLADPDHGWAASHAGVWWTGDGGQTWANVLSVPAGQATDQDVLRPGYTADVQCIDADTAWVLFTAPGGMMQTGWALYHTGDGGATWTPVAQSGQFFPETGAPHGTGGWNRVRLAAVDGSTAYIVGTCVPCSPPGVQEAGTVSLGVSRDAGQSWQDLPPLPGSFGPAIVSAPFAASFPTPELGWLIAPGSTTLYATADSGASWTSRSVDVAR
jgi:photosystem II stability/assembly factor-like uncharacterized protein